MYSRRSGGAVLAALLLNPAAWALQPTEREAAVAVDRADGSPPQDPVRELVSTGLRWPWSIAFLPDGRLLVSEKYSGLRLVSDGVPAPGNVAGGPPDVYAHEDSGYLDVVLDPDFARNQLVYLAYAQGTQEANRTAIWRARLVGDRLLEGRNIFRTGTAKVGPSHPGGRLLFLPDSTLLLTVGDGFRYRDAAQDMGSHLGKVLRLTRDGAPAPDNPFVGHPGTLPEIWTSGHRNIQGLARDPATGEIWAHEHGPRGGDELNLLRPGANYGWPKVTHGVDYEGPIISAQAFAPLYERARIYWAPSIAPSGLTVYRGDRYPGLTERFFLGALAARAVVRVRRGDDSGLLVEEQRMFPALRARIRDVRTGPDGYIYVLTDAENGELWRLRPGTTGA